MNITLPSAVVGVLLAAFCVPLTAYARQAGTGPDPADAAAPVPTPVYVSAFQDSARSSAAPQTPDKVWRAANDALWANPGQGAHAGHAPPQPAGQAPAPQPAAAHSQHHH